jgi:hypothetical protein
MFRRKSTETVRVYDTPQYQEGQIVFRAGEWPRSPLVIYKNSHRYYKNEYCIFAAEFLWDENETDPGIMFVRNVTIAETMVTTRDVAQEVKKFLDISYKHNVDHYEFIKDSRAYFADQASTQTLFTVTVKMVTGPEHKWADLNHNEALMLYNQLHIAMHNGQTWEANKTVRTRQTLNGKYMVSVDLV